MSADMIHQTNDQRQAVPMVDQACANREAVGVKPAIGAAVMDSGFYRVANTQAIKSRGIYAYVATERLRHHEDIPQAPRGRIPADLSAKQWMARKLRTKKGPATYAKCKG